MSERLLAFGFWAEPWSERMVQASWQGAVVLAVAWAIGRWCTFLSPRVICWVWRLACLKLVVALLWVQPINLPLLSATPAATVSHETIGSREPRAQSARPEPSLIEGSVFVGQNDAPPPAEPNRTSLLPLLQVLWLAGICGCVVITFGRWRSIRRLCREAQPTRRAALHQLLRLEAENLGIRWQPEIRCSAHADGPLLAGIGRPKIVLPDRVEESLDESELRLILAHELAHLKRRDLLWNWLPTIVGWLFWFHPLVWLMKRGWTEAQEAACDELLIQTRVARPAEYGRLLLKLTLRWQQRSGTSLIAARMFGSSHNLERRIRTMARVRAFSSRRLIITALVLSLVALPGIVPWRLVAQESPPAAARSAKTSTSAIPTQTISSLQPSFIGSTSSDGALINFSFFVAGQMPGKIYTWAAFELKTLSGGTERFGGPIAIDPNTGKWEKLDIDGSSIRVSPRADLLTFCRYGQPDPQTRFRKSDIFFSNLQGGQPVRVAESGGSQVWSSDGKRLLYNTSTIRKCRKTSAFAAQCGFSILPRRKRSSSLCRRQMKWTIGR